MDLFGIITASILSLFAGTQSAATSGAFFDAYDPHAQAVVLFGGDMMFDRSVHAAAERSGEDFLLACIDAVLADSDLTVANLEGPITHEPSVSQGSAVGSANNFVFTFPWSTAQLLKRHHIEMVNLGNNHMLNFGYSGARATALALDSAGVRYFGDPMRASFATTTVKGIPLAFISYNEFDDEGAAYATFTTINQITQARREGFLPIVYTHWGIEYEPIAAQYVRDRAHKFVDAGAVAVIGSHPHVVQDNEVYRDVPIYYSLGNFVFDQYFTEEVRHGLFLKITFDREGVESIEEIPIVLNRDRTVCPL